MGVSRSPRGAASVPERVEDHEEMTERTAEDVDGSVRKALREFVNFSHPWNLRSRRLPRSYEALFKEMQNLIQDFFKPWV